MTGSWDAFGDIEKQASELRQKLELEEANINRLFYLAFTTEPGKAVLEYFKKNTLDKPSIMSGMGLFDAIGYGHRREGQNDIIREIIIRMNKAIEE